MLLMFYIITKEKKDTYHLRVTLGAAVDIFYLLISCNRDSAGLNLCSTTTSGLSIHRLPWGKKVCFCCLRELVIEWACICLQCGRKRWKNERLLIHQLLVASLWHKICHCMLEVHNKVSGQPRGGKKGWGKERRKNKKDRHMHRTHTTLGSIKWTHGRHML